MGRGPLDGVRVLDLTRVWSGPLAARILADLGADVLLVEDPDGRGSAEVPRLPGGTFSYPNGDPGKRPWNRYGLFNKLHRNRRSLVLDLKTARGRDLFLGLVAMSDVVLENFSARVMPSLGLDYGTLRKANGRIVYVAMPGFGGSGPYRDWVSYGPSLEPMTGLAALLGYDDTELRNSCVALPDAVGGVTAALATVLALRRRDVTGTGAHVDLSQHESTTALYGEYFIERQLTGAEPTINGNAHPDDVPSSVYRCRGEDEWLCLAVRDEEEWSALCHLASRDWDTDTRFSSREARLAHRTALDKAIEEWTRQQDKFALMDELQAVGVPAGAVVNAPELLSDPHLSARGYWTEIAEHEAGTFRYPGTPITINGVRAEDWTPAPRMGEHNDEILSELLGLGSDAVAGLRRDGVIMDGPPPVR